jgi:hypothetical protein
MKSPFQALQGNRFLGVARITFGSGGVPTTGFAPGHTFPGFSVARGTTGVYTMAFPAMRDAIPCYSITRATGLSGGIQHAVGLTFEHKGPSGAATGIGSFHTTGVVHENRDPADTDQIAIWFYATDSDAS